MKKEVIFAVSSYNEKYFFSPITKNLPLEIKKDIKKIGIYFVSKISGIFTTGFYENGDFFIDYKFLETDFDYDEIGAKLEIEKIKREKKQLISSLMLWYKILKKID